MGRYIIAYHAPFEARVQHARGTPEQAHEEDRQWTQWERRLGPALLYGGKRLGQSVDVSAIEREPGDSDIVRISIIEAADMQVALALIEDHPHLDEAGICGISVHEEIAE